MTSYTELVTSFLSQLRTSPALAARLYNETYPRTLSRIELPSWEPMTAEDAADPDMLEMETMTREEMRAKLEEQGYDDDVIEEQMRGVAIDDSHVLSVFVNVQDPNNPVIVQPCDYKPFAAHCGDEEYFWGGVATWRTIQEFAEQLAADQHILMTMDGGMALSFALPTPATGGRRHRRHRSRSRKHSKRVRRTRHHKGSKKTRKTQRGKRE